MLAWDDADTLSVMLTVRRNSAGRTATVKRRSAMAKKTKRRSAMAKQRAVAVKRKRPAPPAMELPRPVPNLSRDDWDINFPRKMTSDIKIKVGSDCSGWASEVHALNMLGLKQNIYHRFGCDIAKSSKTIIFNNCQPKAWYDDCMNRENSKVASTDLYVAGFPCQPFSSAGKNHGIHAQRGTVFDGIFDYIIQHTPTIFVLENVKNLTSSKHKSTFDAIMGLLKNIRDPAPSKRRTYWVNWRIYNSKDHGVPQIRERLYIVGMRMSHIVCHQSNIESKFKSMIEECIAPTPNIHQFIVRTKNRMDRATIERQIKKDLRSSAMFSGTGRRNLTMAMKQIRSANLDPSTSEIVVDLGQGRSKVHMMHNLCPTITRTRAARDDFFLVSNASRITALDCMHLQGLNSFKVDLNGLKCSEIGQLAGNAMTIPVLAAILQASLVLTGMAKDIDVEPVVDRHAPRVRPCVLTKRVKTDGL
jgi:DNA-cytosine methyltransferase